MAEKPESKSDEPQKRPLLRYPGPDSNMPPQPPRHIDRNFVTVHFPDEDPLTRLLRETGQTLANPFYGFNDKALEAACPDPEKEDKTYTG